MSSPALLCGFPVAKGGDGKNQANRIAQQKALVLSGNAIIEIPLNGGSDTRRAVRESWKERAEAWGVGFKNIGNCYLIIGGRP
jgi:hypothetical protein